jgi:hypothetical protein
MLTPVAALMSIDSFAELSITFQARDAEKAIWLLSED